MANAETETLTDVDRCLALTSNGERCSRPAQENGFCFQHDEDDPTVEESDDIDADSMEEAAEELEDLTVDGGEVEAASAEEDESSDGDTSSDDEDESTDDEGSDDDDGSAEDDGSDGDDESTEEETDSSEGESSEADSPESSADGASGDDLEDVTIELDEPVDLTSVRDVVRSTGSDLIGRPLDAVIAVSTIDDGWRAVVECVERRAVPDTQDILGQYELLFDDDGTIQQYRRLERYRRSDTRAEDEERFER